MVYFPRLQWNVYHRIDGMLLASSKYGNHQLAFKPIRKRAHIFWMSNKLSGFSSKSVLSSRSLLKVTLKDIFPQENLSDYLKIMVSNIVLWGDWFRSIYQIPKKTAMLTMLKEIYLQTRCLLGPLSVSNKGTRDIDWKNNEHSNRKPSISLSTLDLMH